MQKITPKWVPILSKYGRTMHSSDQHCYHQLRFMFPKKIGVDYKKKYLLNVFPFKSVFEEHQASMLNL